MRRASICIAFSLLIATACDSGGEEGHGGGHGEHGEVVVKPGLPPRLSDDEKKAAEGEQSEAGDASEQPVAKADPPVKGELGKLQAKVKQFAPAKLTAKVDDLPEGERKALDALIEAAKYLDPIFDRQAWAGNPKLMEELSRDTTELGKAKYAYVKIMRGPWDRQAEFEPFATETKRPHGAGFYPEDLTEKEFDEYVEANPGQKAELESLVTVVERDGDKLEAVPYSEAYKEWLEPAAAKLREAADATGNKSLARFLRSRADAFSSDDYYRSDKDWMDLDSRVEITIGPYETYEDELKGAKAAFEAFVTVADPDASERLAKYKEMLPEMEENLPIPAVARGNRGAESPIRVVDLVYTSGDARKSVQTIAFNLPNDERVRKEKGAKKVMLRNIINTKFEQIMRPIAEKILVEDQVSYLSAEAFFNETLFHELSHTLGPAFTEVDGKRVEVREALGASASAIEEGKADVMGAYNILYMIEREQFPLKFKERLLVSYFAGLFRSVRFGVAEAHGKGAAFQINRFLEDGAATFDEKTGKFTVNLDKLEESIKTLVTIVCMLQHEGDKEAVDAFLAKYAKMTPEIEQALSKLDGIPVDINPIYPLAGER